MCLCNPAIKLPTAALMQPYRIHPPEQIPYRNPAILRSGNQSTNQTFLIPHICSFSEQCHFINLQSYCQATKNTLTVLSVNATARQVFLYLASSALPSMLLPGKQGPDSCLLLCKQCTDPDLRQFLHRLVGNTSQTQKSHFVRATRFLQKHCECLSTILGQSLFSWD